MSIMQVLLSREGLSPDGSVEVSEDTLAAIESSDVEADAVESDIEAVTEANEEAAEVEEAVEDEIRNRTLVTEDDLIEFLNDRVRITVE